MSIKKFKLQKIVVDLSEGAIGVNFAAFSLKSLLKTIRHLKYSFNCNNIIDNIGNEFIYWKK